MSRPKLRVLMVEDSIDDAELLLLELRRSGYEPAYRVVDSRSSTEQALREGEWDLLLSDHAMPGFSAQGAIALLAESGRDLPCIVVSGAIGEEAAVALLKAGAVDYVNKNRLFQLGPAVERALREAEERRARRRAEAALRESEERFRLIAENARDLIAMTDLAGRYLYASPSHGTILGYGPEQLLLAGPLELIHPEDRAALGAWRALEHFEVRMRDAGGAWRWVEGSTAAVDWQGEQHLVSIMRDISQHREMTERLKHLAFFDTLTDLPNRTLLRDRLAQALGRAARTGELLAVMYVDFDNFKVLNDSLGHEVGDQVLRVLAERISCSVRGEDTVARFGGDEFVILLPALPAAEAAARVAEGVLAEVSRPLLLGLQELRLEASIGIALSQAGSPGLDDLLKHADLAMYRAKEQGKGHYHFFTPELGRQAVERHDLERELRRALERDEFDIFYQPRLELATLRVTGVEALARWRHPRRGLMQPEEFIPLAEETGVIRALGEIILVKACRQAVEWRRLGARIERMAVNLSARQLQVPSFVESVERALRDSGLEASALELEITESATLSSRQETMEALSQLKRLGIHLSIDDFGTGYSSLSYLKRLPMDSLKVDRNFVRDIVEGDTGEDAAILRAVVALGKNLGLGLVGEGIEREEQLRFLTELGFDEGQGYLFSEPLPAAEALRFLLGARSQDRSSTA